MKRMVVLFALANAGANAQVPVDGGSRNLLKEAQWAVGQVPAAKKALSASGTPDAARLACIRFINVLYGVQSEKIETVVLESTASSALVRASYPSQQCDLTLVRNAAANEYGWAIQLHKCQGKQ
ncbi:hypothetical protein [Massilia sp. NR 4-1]|uniref:hypothetical protein n=1 Tax=Massilia sp. NR 4-1 TaxID=1678028 RepID=UPI00067DF2A6|nr:hypothetical protein [Massilia sp. NR 4-1]AKU21234.1 hypothetical protein ACZ75_06825 [Massilia sp. NR 4-1]